MITDRLRKAVRSDDIVGRIGGDELRASIGVAWTKAKDACADTLVREADTAMYESKRLNVGRPVLFDPSLDAR